MKNHLRFGFTVSVALVFGCLSVGCVAQADSAPDVSGVDEEEVGTSQEAIVAGASVVLKPRHASGKCVDVKDVSTAPGAPLQLWDCYGGENQRFYLEAMGDGYYRLKAAHSNLCLDAGDFGNPNDGASLRQWSCGNTPSQQFKVEYVDSNYYRLVAKHNGKCVDVSGAGTANGTRIQMWTCNGTAAQQFYWDVSGRNSSDRASCASGDGGQCYPDGVTDGVNYLYGWHFGMNFGSSSARFYDAIDRCALWHDNGCWNVNSRTGVDETNSGCSQSVNVMKCFQQVVPESSQEAAAKEFVMKSALRVGADICDPAGWGTLYPIYPATNTTSNSFCTGAWYPF